MDALRNAGTALLAWRETKDEYFLNQVLCLAPHYREKVFTRYMDTHHDLGFLYSLYSVALYKLTGDKAHREVGLRAAEVLSQRFNEKGNFIRNGEDGQSKACRSKRFETKTDPLPPYRIKSVAWFSHFDGFDGSVVPLTH
jgi:hypothetical protein